MIRRDKTCRDVSRRIELVGQHGATRSSRQARQARFARHVDMSASFFSPKVVPEIDANPEHNRLNLYTRALLLLRRPPCWNKHGSTRSTRSSRQARHARHVVRVLSRRDVTSQLEYGLYSFTRFIFSPMHEIVRNF